MRLGHGRLIGIWLAGVAGVIAVTWWLVARGTRGAEIASDIAAVAVIVGTGVALWPLLGARRPGDERPRLAGSGSQVEAGRTLSALGSQPASARRGSARLDRAGRESQVSRQIALWGPPNSGKTCFLAALNTAVIQTRSARWVLTGADPASTQMLVDTTISLVGDREFPIATALAVERYRWKLATESEVLVRQGFRRRASRLRQQLNLEIIDASGGLFSEDWHGTRNQEDLARALASSDGIIFFFDPIMEDERPSTMITHMVHMLAELERRLERQGRLDGIGLPHRVAVCVTKFDRPRILNAADASGHLVVAGDDPRMVPRVADERAEQFFDELGRKSGTGGLNLVHDSISRYFHPSRTRYFATSAIGFYLGDQGRFDPADYYNVVDTTKHGPVRIRGMIHPINVLEPILWLAAGNDQSAEVRPANPACASYTITEERQPGPALPTPREMLYRQASQAAPSSLPRRPSDSDFRGRSHLICMVESSGADDDVSERVRRASQLIVAATSTRPRQVVSLISYGPHAIANMPEEPSCAWTWAQSGEEALAAIDRLYDRGAANVGYPRAAQLECVLADLAERLRMSERRCVLVTIGARPAFPPRLDPATEIIPCPKRIDWRAAVQQLRQLPDIAFGAIVDDNPDDEIWAQLSSDALADPTLFDQEIFTARLGLV